ncbi:MAG: NAD(P)/FAD-dependent oxidoreductase [Thermoplasmataceae archaeon]
MINVAGLGMAGSYLMRRLRQEGLEARGFDPKRPDFYIPCGYATNLNRLKSFATRAGIDPENYVLYESKGVTFSGNNFEPVTFPARGIGTFDKNQMEKDMVAGLEIYREPLRISNNAITVDATGISRSLLGKHNGDEQMYAVEYVTDKAMHEDFYFHFFARGVGYYWEFPLGEHYHVGAGAVSREIVMESLKGIKGRRVTGRKIRMKPLLDIVSSGNIIGVGESIGLVSPITGEGILPALESAEILVQCLKRYDDLESVKQEFKKKVSEKFNYYYGLHELVSAVQHGEKLGLKSLKWANSARKDLVGFGIGFSVMKVIRHFL